MSRDPVYMTLARVRVCVPRDVVCPVRGGPRGPSLIHLFMPVFMARRGGIVAVVVVVLTIATVSRTFLLLRALF